MKGKVQLVQNKSQWPGLGKRDFFLFRCPCSPRPFSYYRNQVDLPTHCPDCGNELEESTDLKDFE